MNLYLVDRFIHVTKSLCMVIIFLTKRAAQRWTRSSCWISLAIYYTLAMDYCNAVLAGLPWSTVAPLQRVQNAAARLVLGLSPRDHVSSALVDRGVNGGGDGGMHPLQHFGQGDAMPLIPPLLLLPF